MDDKKKLPLPEKELPAPHDMLLSASSKKTSEPKSSQNAGLLRFPTIWEKYGSKKWLLPLLILIGILILVVGLAGFMNSQNDNGDRDGKRDKRENRREKNRNNNKRNKNKNKSKNKNKKNRRNAKATANPGTISFSYGSGVNAITMQYPGDMRTDITNGVSILDGKSRTTIINFSGGKNILKMTLEPNTTNLSAASWQSQLAKKNSTYNTPTQQITVSGKPAILQHTLSATANWNAFVPMSGMLLWVDMNYGGGKNKAQEDFQEILDTIKIGQQNTTIPSSTPL